ncbi:MAG: exopolyphosphatase [Leptospiraceae bacterium]|nr:MAG: exopolyphosphatase [Leptospiraceae bacterium]
MLNRPIAAIDMGTNSFHMIIAKKENNHVDVLDREKIVVRLGEGGSDYDYITEEAEKRAIQALKSFKSIAKKYNAIIQAVATSAVREAKNQNEFLKKVYKETGIKVKVIPGQEEGRLIYLGILQIIPAYDKYTLVIDIGGGSTEIILGYQAKPLFIRSLKLGAVRLTERFFPKGIIKPDKIKEAENYIRNFIIDTYEEFQNQNLNYELVVGSSGTIKTIVELIHENQKKEFSFEELNTIVEKILKYETPDKRQKKLNLDEKRADIIPAGALILKQIFEIFKIHKMVYSPYALREGVLFELLYRKNKKSDLREIRRNSCINLLKKFHQEIPYNTANISLKILKFLGKDYPELLSHKELLEYAALLHNIGVAIAHTSHHKHSYYIISQTEYLLGFTKNELDIIACISRYHRKAFPNKKHLEFMSLSSLEQNLIEFYAGILRIAIGLSRTHLEPDIQIEKKENTYIFYVITKNLQDSELLCNMADLRKDLLEYKLQKKIHFISK